MAALSSLTDVQYARLLAIGDTAVASVSDDDLDSMLELASGRLPSVVWGDHLREAAALMALHMIASGPTGTGSSAGGPVTGESVGQWSQQRGGASDLSASRIWMLSSVYGQRLYQLAMTRAERLPFVAR